MTTPVEQGHVWWRRGGLTLLCLVAAAGAPAAREYRTSEIESLRVTIDSDWASRAAPGYVPVRFDITNDGDARVIEIVEQGSRFITRGPRGAGSAQTMLRQSVRLGRGDRVHLTIPVPAFGDSESIRFEIQEDGRRLDAFNYQGFQGHATPAEASALLVAASGTAFGAIASKLPRTLVATRGGYSIVVPSAGPAGTVAVTPGGVVVSGGGSGRGASVSAALAGGGAPGGAPQLDFVLEPARLPANWLGFTSVRAVAIGATEWTQLNDGQKNALLTWTACGGDLIFVDGDLRTLLPSAPSEIASDPARVVARHFFGRVHVVTSPVLDAAGFAKMLSAADKFHDVHWAMPANTAPDWGAIEARGFRLAIPGVGGVQARVYVGILVCFSLLIGPVNYWFLRRRRRQVLLVLTAPLISAAFIVVLTGYAIAGEGFSVQGRAVTFTMLDQATKQAATRASVSLYAAGVMPPGGLTFARDVAVFPLGADGAGTRDRLNLDLTDAQFFAGGVLHARSPTNFEEVAFRPARERLTFSPESGGLSVTNGLEARIVALFYRDGDTLYRLSSPLANGAKQTLVAAPPGATPTLPAEVPVPAKLLALLQRQPRGSYLAVLDGSPFWASGLSGVIERGSLHVVLGWPEGQR